MTHAGVVHSGMDLEYIRLLRELYLSSYRSTGCRHYVYVGQEGQLAARGCTFVRQPEVTVQEVHAKQSGLTTCVKQYEIKSRGQSNGIGAPLGAPCVSRTEGQNTVKPESAHI